MNVSDIISALDDHGFDDRSTSRKMEVINDSYLDVLSRQPWPFLEAASTSVTINSSTGQITSPTDIHKILMLVDYTNSIKLDPERFEFLTKQFGQLTSGNDNPLYYYPIGSSFYVYPVPSSSATYHIYYLKAPSDLTSSSVEADILLPRKHHRLLVLGAASKLHAMDDDLDLSEKFAAQFEARIFNMQEDIWMRQYDRPERIYNAGSDFEQYWG